MVKKLTGLVALIVALLVMPTMVSATSLKTTCDKSCPTEDGKCTATCTIKIEENTTYENKVFNEKILIEFESYLKIKENSQMQIEDF